MIITPITTDMTTLRKGSKGEEVKRLQRLLHPFRSSKKAKAIFEPIE